MKSVTHTPIVVLACTLLAFCSCRVQNAPGAYIPAEGEIPAKETLAKKPKKEEIKPAPQTQADENIASIVSEEKEVTRAENFSVIEGESESDLKAYHVVIGSFKSQENAKRLQARMRPDYKPIIVINERGMYRVLLASYDDYASAKRKIADIKSQFADAWVLVQKK